MSTRAVIARPDGNGGFVGSFHHWDGYPSGVGKTIFKLLRGHFRGNVTAMLRVLCDEHTTWSTINSDWSQPLNNAPASDEEACQTCGLLTWQHYRQYYEGRDVPLPDGAREGVLVLGHGPKVALRKYGPECHCHNRDGSVSDSPESAITHNTASSVGCEYAYVIDAAKRTMTIAAAHIGDGETRMVGMFGQGDPDAVWATLAVVDLDGPEPVWEQIG